MAYLPDLDTVVQRYLDAWNADDPDRRWHLVHDLAAPEVVFLDPREAKPVEGQAALAAFVGLIHDQTGQRLEATGPPDAHHGWVRFPWRLVTSGGEVASAGVLVGSLDREMRFTRIVQFLGG